MEGPKSGAADAEVQNENKQAADVTKADLKLHTQVPSPSSEPNLEMILDIPLRVAVELGRAKILVQDLLKLQKGSVVELSKMAGEPLEILVNERVVAKGEVVVVGEKFGVRLVEIVNHAQRIRELGIQ